MKITLYLMEGRMAPPTKAGVQKNIDALERSIKGAPPQPRDSAMHRDTVAILKAIQRQLPGVEPPTGKEIPLKEGYQPGTSNLNPAKPSNLNPAKPPQGGSGK